MRIYIMYVCIKEKEIYAAYVYLYIYDDDLYITGPTACGGICSALLTQYEKYHTQNRLSSVQFGYAHISSKLKTISYNLQIHHQDALNANQYTYTIAGESVRFQTLLLPGLFPVTRKKKKTYKIFDFFL